MPPAMISTEVSNADCPWDEFNPELYFLENYKDFYEDDARILKTVRDYFEAALGGVRAPTEGIDVGAGANLYPSLAMLPYCSTVTLFERGLENRRWLYGQREHYSSVWDPYWELLSKSPQYRRLEPRQAFRHRMRVRHGDILQPANARNRWGVGTMFFCAESITQREREFQLAVNNFIGMLKPGAPFAAAFMRESTGYRLGGIDFPAVSIGPVDVEHHLERRVDDLQVTSVVSGKPLREGYKGMILALGRKRRARG
jgi:NNMT/PNMT/TEMT family